MGFLDLQSFCCGLAPLHLGCKVIAFASTVFSFAVFAVVSLIIGNTQYLR